MKTLNSFHNKTFVMIPNRKAMTLRHNPCFYKQHMPPALTHPPQENFPPKISPACLHLTSAIYISCFVLPLEALLTMFIFRVACTRAHKWRHLVDVFGSNTLRVPPPSPERLTVPMGLGQPPDFLAWRNVLTSTTSMQKLDPYRLAG